jgi:hypothetical protein
MEAIWSALQHFGQPGSTLISLEALWSDLEAHFLSLEAFFHPGCTFVSLEAL